VHSRKVDNFWSIFLNNQSSAADTIRIEVCEGKIFVIRIDLDNVTKKDSAILLESFDNG
jgi:hemolysin activation/secretion protein